MKLILILLVVGAALWLWRGSRAAPTAATSPRGKPASGSAHDPASRSPVPMVACAFCGLHVPRAEAFDSPSRLHYCCEAHRIEHLRQGRSHAGSASGPR
jgi:uncharacterized protein